MIPNNLHILITGAGAPGIRGTLYALHHNSDGVKVRTTGVDARSDVVGGHFVDSFQTVPAPEAPGYVDEMLGLCRRTSVDLVLPQTTREIAVLSRHRDRFQQAGIPVIVAGGGAIETGNDKGKLLDIFRTLSLPYPEYRRAAGEAELISHARELGYPERPVVVKPPVSNGMRGLRILMKNAWDVRRFLSEKPGGTEISLEELVGILRRGERWPELIVCEYLPGPEYSVDAFIGRRCRHAIPRLRRAIRSGISFENQVEFRQDLFDYTLTAGSHIGLEYAFGFQFKLDAAGIPKVLECNPRVQGTMVASLFSGVNVIWLAVREALGDTPDTPAAGGAAPTPALFYRFWGGLGIQDGNVYEI